MLPCIFAPLLLASVFYTPGMGAMMVWSAGAGDRSWDGAGEAPAGPLFPPGAGPAGWASVGCTVGADAAVVGAVDCCPVSPGPLKEEPEVSDGRLSPGPAGPAGTDSLPP